MRVARASGVELAAVPAVRERERVAFSLIAGTGIHASCGGERCARAHGDRALPMDRDQRGR